MNANPTVSAATQCPNGHPLVRNDDASFSCDDCYADYTQDHPNHNHSSHRCATCDYDRCIGCSSLRLGKMCPSLHPLTAHVTPPAADHCCDLCGAMIAPGDAVASCPACDYDVCRACVFGPRARVSGAATPQSPIMNNANDPHTCPDGHVLIGREDSDCECDVCREPAEHGERALECEQCDYDICVGCIAFENGNVCPDHPNCVLAKGACGQTTNAKANTACNVCGDALLPAGSSVLFCTQPSCSYQACKACIFASDRAAAPNFPVMWAAVKAFNGKRFPRFARRIIKEKIIPKARGADPPNNAELTKAAIYLALETIEDANDIGDDVGMVTLERELSEQTFITRPADIAFTHSILGGMYEDYLAIVADDISDRADPGEDAPLPTADVTSWAPAQLERAAFSHHLKSLAQCELLANEDFSSQYEALLTAKKPFLDEDSVVARPSQSLLDFVARRAFAYFRNNADKFQTAEGEAEEAKKAYTDTQTFAGLSFDATGTSSRALQALLMYQTVLHNKLAALAAAPASSAARSDAIFSLIDVEMARAEFVRVAPVAGLTAEGEKAAHYERLLLGLVAPAADCPAAAARVCARLGAFYVEKRVDRRAPADGEADADINMFETSLALQYFGRVAQVCPAPDDSPMAWAELQEQLSIAAQKGRIDAVNALIAAKADVNAKDKEGRPPIYVASGKGHTAVVKALIAAGADVNAGHEQWGSPLHCAAHEGHIDVVEALIAAKADVNATTANNWGSPLYTASREGRIAVVKALIAAGANVNAAFREDWTSLHGASGKGHIDVVEALIAAEADVNAEDTAGWTPLHFATGAASTIAVMAALIAAGANVNAADTEGKTPLHSASEEGAIDVVKTLIAAGADVNATDEDGKTPLHCAVEEGHIDVVRALIAAEADVNATDEEGRTPLTIASGEDCAEVIGLLKAAGAQDLSS